MDTILSLSQLEIGFNNRCIVEGINTDLKHQEFLAVVGINGCGKTSFIRALMGDCKILSGSAHFLGKPLTYYDHKLRSRYIALMGQHNTCEPRMSVKDYIALGRFPHFHYCTRQEDKKYIDKVIEELALGEMCNKTMGSLSGGEFQRVNLARVLTQEPKLLLLDEPTNHLDPKAKIELLNIVKQKKITTVAVLHDLHLVEHFADRVMVFNQGKMQVCDTVNIALDPQRVKETFGLDTLEFTHPTTGKTIRFFDMVL
ncbi:ABC transporter ATP-binding protein [Photobacterium leiognathi]|uniref:ABC transporter ATP-binding protein n=1 Tax=Photobacterium leiognathi TaxID=553611 RepID=UPI0029826726|nr:ABC transporter ATP-binding protein [Photobacterium leiognathi]